MTQPTDIDAIPASFPAKAEFECGPYGDGSGFEITVAYDATEKGAFASSILLQGYDVSFDFRHAEEVVSAIRYCAAALRAKQEQSS